MPKLRQERQEKFCREYLLDADGPKAAIRAGYAERSAARQSEALLSKPDVNTRILELQTALIESGTLSPDWVTHQLSRCVRIAMGDFASSADESERNRSAKPPDIRSAIRGLELLGKRFGLFDSKYSLDESPIVITGGDALED